VRVFLRLAAMVMLALGLGMGLSLPALAQVPAAPIAPAAAPAEAPAAPRSGPSEVKIGMYINDIQSIDLASYSFVADVYVWLRDSDPDLKPGDTFEWMNMFAPDDHVQTTIYEVPERMPDGSDYQVFRHQGPFAAKFSIKTFPFDKHTLTIEIEDREFDAGRLVYVAEEVTINPEIQLPGFIIGKPTIRIENRPYPTAFGDIANPTPAPYSRAVVTIPISRPVWSGIVKSMLPLFIVILVAAAALLLGPEHVEARVGLSITALLTLVALQFSAMTGLPEVGYLLMLDQVYIASYAFVLLVVGLLVFTTNQEDKAQEDRALASGGAHAITRGGPLAAFLAVLLYAAIIALILFLNAGQAQAG
jgi:hypothetical protein